MVRAFFQIQFVCTILTMDKLIVIVLKRGLLPDKKATREDLLERVRANMRPPPRA